jgi:branched-chain amino acid transport system permease protein
MTEQFSIERKKSIGFLAGVVFLALIPLFVSSPYYLDLFIMVLVNAMLSMTFLMMVRTGLISLGIAAFWGVGSYVSVVIATTWGVSFWVAIILATLITGALALVLGFVLVRNAGITFVVLTVVVGMLFPVVVGSISALGGHHGITDIPPPSPIRIPGFPALEFTSKIPFFYLALFLLVVVVLVINAFYSAWTGRAWTAIGLNYRLAESLGIDVFRYRLLSFVTASAIAGMTGSFYAHYAAFVAPDSYGIFATINFQVYALLGGIGYPILGPVIGAAIMTFIPEMVRVTQTAGPIISGVLLIALVMFLPRGLLSLFAPRKTAHGEPHIMAKLTKMLASSRRTGRGGDKPEC